MTPNTLVRKALVAFAVLTLAACAQPAANNAAPAENTAPADTAPAVDNAAPADDAANSASTTRQPLVSDSAAAPTDRRR